MATIKDIAALAGVSHGTVSNVLNGRGNVSVEKITLVENAAKQLGYTINAQARQLRKGSSKRVGVVVPQLELKKYRDLFLGIEQELREHEFEVDLYYSNDLNYYEEKVLQKIETTNPIAIVMVSSFLKDVNMLRGDSSLILVERKPESLPREAVFCGFDYELAGKEMAGRCISDGHRNAAVFTGNTKYSNYGLFVKGIEAVFLEKGCNCRIFSSDDITRGQTAFELLTDRDEFDAVITSDPENSAYLKAVLEYRQKDGLPPVYALSSKEVGADEGVVKYELNYRLCGKMIGKYIEKLELEEPVPSKIPDLKNDGFHQCPVAASENPEELKILMLSGPTCRALNQLIPQFTRKTGIRVKLMEAGYDELYRMVKSCVQFSPYDLIRLDMAWMSELGEKLFLPLPVNESWLQKIRENFSENLSDDYYKVGANYLTLPFDPSVQMLYYRKDLFQDARIRREFYEVYRRQLEVPVTFEEYDQIARFFTRRYHKNSPVSYGTSLVFGSSVVAACDYLPRLRAAGGHIFDKTGKISLNTEPVKRTLLSYRDAFEYTDRETNSWWRKAMEDFSCGRVAMNIVFANYASIMLHSKESEALGKIGFAPVPGECPMLGGGVLGISRHSKKREACREFLKWIYDEKTAAMITYLGGYINHKKIKENLDVLELYPWLEDMEKSFAVGWRRDFEHLKAENDPGGHPVQGFNEFVFEDILGNAVRAVVSGIMSPEEALEAAQQRCRQEFGGK
ncbi:extracellular solute-binding protein [Clostridium sp. MCC353]|uniref:extracellular solute-binding protein n=1 Tax=Clostridium sp. MCC353 TaxID=2592646 RepID=UPI001C036D81|nr:extracellular solute-binding protein [Clostridium sp. MCC353]MBT9778694.1 extracellular solute-binding protein [Clostridium sp. MCC353]